jgi:hypothetical protein
MASILVQDSALLGNAQQTLDLTTTIVDQLSTANNLLETIAVGSVPVPIPPQILTDVHTCALATAPQTAAQQTLVTQGVNANNTLTLIAGLNNTGNDKLNSLVGLLTPKPSLLKENLKLATIPPPETPFSVGQSSYSVVDNVGTVGYYGNADINAYSAFNLSASGYPLIAQPYILDIKNNLDLPTSQVSSQIAQAVTDSAAHYEEGSLIWGIPNLDMPMSVALEQGINAFIPLLASIVDNTFQANARLDGVIGVLTAILSRLEFQPSASIQINPDSTTEVTQYQGPYGPMSVAELLSRALFCSSILSDTSSISGRRVEYGFMPYLSAIVPTYAVAGNVGVDSSIHYPLGKAVVIDDNNTLQRPYDLGFDPYIEVPAGSVIDSQPCYNGMYLNVPFVPPSKLSPADKALLS